LCSLSSPLSVTASKEKNKVTAMCSLSSPLSVPVSQDKSKVTALCSLCNPLCVWRGQCTFQRQKSPIYSGVGWLTA
jgi:hypothetical protein